MPDSLPRSDAAYRPAYYVRRELTPAELLPAIGAGIGAGLAIFYVARLFLERTPLDVRPTRPSDASESPTRYRFPG